MVWEAIAALVVGVVALALILEPLAFPRAQGPASADPLDPEETPRGVALSAIREIEFDKATGKLSDADYQFLLQKYTAEALAVLKAEEAEKAERTEKTDGSDQIERLVAARVHTLRSSSPTSPSSPTCPTCGPRPEPDAIFCSHCGGRLLTPSGCLRCGVPLHPDGRFCEGCGAQVAA
jgi:hypothetical protein